MVSTVRNTVLPLLSLAAIACGGPVEVDVQVVNPCNQDAIGSVEFLKFVPRGGDLGDGFATTYGINDSGIEPIELPLVPDFSIFASGHPAGGDGLPDFRTTNALGISAKYDIVNSGGPIGVKIPFGLVDSFYRTTALEGDASCTDLGVDRFGATATYLAGSEKVLIVGGARIIQTDPPEIQYPRSVELYDPATGLFRPVAELRVGGARKDHTATPLGDGRVLIAGGNTIINGVNTALRTAFIIDANDPNDVRIAESGLAMREPRTGHQAIRLGDGRVLLIGGRELVPGALDPRDHAYSASLELYDPADQVFAFPNDPVGNALSMSQSRYGHSATLLASGQDILVVGGMNEQGVVDELEVITVTDTATVTAPPSAITGVGPVFHAAAIAEDDTILLSGGYNRIEDAEPAGGMPQNPSAAVEMWAWTGRSLSRVCNASMSRARGHHVVEMSRKDAIFVGGRGMDGAPLNVGEVATLVGGASCFGLPPSEVEMDTGRIGHAVAKIDATGEILITGGLQQNQGDPFGVSLSSAEVFRPLGPF